MALLLQRIIAPEVTMAKLMTLAEAARSLGIRPVTLRAAVHRGVLRAELYGKTWLVTPREVERYRAEHLGRGGRPPKS